MTRNQKEIADFKSSNVGPLCPLCELWDDAPSDSSISPPKFPLPFSPLTHRDVHGLRFRRHAQWRHFIMCRRPKSSKHASFYHWVPVRNEITWILWSYFPHRFTSTYSKKNVCCMWVLSKIYFISKRNVQFRWQSWYWFLVYAVYMMSRQRKCMYPWVF